MIHLLPSNNGEENNDENRKPSCGCFTMGCERHIYGLNGGREAIYNVILEKEK